MKRVPCRNCHKKAAKKLNKGTTRAVFCSLRCAADWADTYLYGSHYCAVTEEWKDCAVNECKYCGNEEEEES